MSTVQDFLEDYVSQNGDARVIINGDYVELPDGATQVNSLPADVYLVINTGIDTSIVPSVDAVVVSSDDGLSADDAQYPKSNVRRANQSLMCAELSDTVFAFTTNGLPHEVEEEVEEVEEVVNTTLPPPPDEGVSFSITGGEAEDDEAEDDEAEDDESEDDDKNDVSGMVW